MGINLVTLLEEDPTVCYNIKIACGGNNKFVFTGISENRIIEGFRIVYLTENKKYIEVLRWDEFGFPMDLQKYPSKYYIRLILPNNREL